MSNKISLKIKINRNSFSVEMGLTKYNSGSTEEVWCISWPMILAAMSNYFMILADRSILSQYSTDAFVAASGAHPFYWANTRAMMAFITMTSVLIGQSHGARKYRQIGKIVWQTIFLSFSYYIVLIPCAIYAREFLASTIEELGAPYLSITLLFLPFHLAGFGAISSFFLGIGRTRIIPTIILVSNIINVVLDFLLIFGLYGFPELGVRGAAYATGISQFIAFLIFLCEFLKKPYKKYYLTHVPRISLKLMRKTLPLGLPNAVNSILNAGGLAIVHQIVAKVCSSDDLLAFTIANSIYLFFWFFIDGLGKGMCTICSNYVGRNQMEHVYRAARSVAIFVFIFATLTSGFMIFKSRITLYLFYANEVTDVFLRHFRFVLFWTWIALVVEAFRWMLQNILVSAGDVHFTMISNVACFWITAFLPIYFLVYKLHLGSSILCWQFFILDSCFRILSNFLRLRSQSWQRKAYRASHGSHFH